MSTDQNEIVEAYAGLISDSINSRQERLERGDKDDKFPIAYLSDGTFVARFFPESYESADGKKRIRLMRKFFSHRLKLKDDNNKDRYVYVSCEGDNCRVCKEASRLYDINYKDAYKYGSKQEALIKAHIYEGPADEYVKTNTTMVLVLNYRQMVAFDDLLADMSPNDAAELFSSSGEQLGIKLHSYYENGRKCSIGFHHKKYALPEIPKDMPSNLDDVYLKKDKFITDEDLQILKKHISQIIANKHQNEDPESNTSAANALSGPETSSVNTKETASVAMQASPSVTQAATGSTEEKCSGIIKKIAGYGYSPGEFHFGSPPPAMNPTCLMCKNRSDCAKAKVSV